MVFYVPNNNYLLKVGNVPNFTFKNVRSPSGVHEPSWCLLRPDENARNQNLKMIRLDIKM